MDRDTAMKHKGFLRGYATAVRDLRDVVDEKLGDPDDILDEMVRRLREVEAE